MEALLELLNAEKIHQIFFDTIESLATVCPHEPTRLLIADFKEALGKASLPGAERPIEFAIVDTIDVLSFAAIRQSNGSLRATLAFPRDWVQDMQSDLTFQIAGIIKLASLTTEFVHGLDPEHLEEAKARAKEAENAFMEAVEEELGPLRQQRKEEEMLEFSNLFLKNKIDNSLPN